MFDADYENWYWAAFFLGALALGLFIYFLLGDRKRARRRCPKCWYDLRDIPGLRCPECGKTARHEKRLHRAHRRKWLLAPVFVLTVASIWAGLQPKIRKDGLASIVPNTILILALRLRDNTAVREEFVHRADEQPSPIDLTWGVEPSLLWPWQWRWLVAAYADIAGDASRTVDERNEAVRMIWNIRDRIMDADIELVAQAVLVELTGNSDPYVRSAAVLASAWRDQPRETFTRMRSAFEDEHVYVRRCAVLGLHILSLEDNDVQKWLLELFEHEDLTIRKSVLDVLYVHQMNNLATPNAFRPALRRLMNDQDERIREDAVRTLSGYLDSDNDRVTFLIEVLKSDDTPQRQGALASAVSDLSSIPESLLPEILRALLSDDGRLSHTASFALGRFKAEQLRPHRATLEQLPEGTSQIVREDVARLLAEIDAADEQD